MTNAKTWATLADVAQAAGVSVRTVARVMSKSPAVKESTAQRVETIARDLGYRSNELARSLKGSRSRTLGLLVPDISNPFFALCCGAIEAAAYQRGYTILLCDSDATADRQREYIDLLIRRRVDGLIVAPTPGGDADLHPDRLNGLPVITIDRTSKGSTCRVVVTNRAGTLEATTHLAGHGHQRIAFLGGARPLYTTHRRMAGFREAVTVDPELVRLDLMSTADAENAMREWWRLPAARRPTAAVAGNSVVAAGIMHWASEAGVALPDDLALVGFDDFDLLGILSPSLSAVRQPTTAMAQLATAVMIDLLDGDRHPRREYMLPTTFSPGRSCGCPARSKADPSLRY